MRPTGWIPDPEPTEEEREAALVFGADLIGDMPRAARLGRPELVLDQRGESCPGMFGAVATWGLSGERVSPYALWYFGRVVDAGGVKAFDALANRNVGCTLGGLLEAYREDGACPDEAWREGVAGFGYHERPHGLARMLGVRRRLDVTPIYHRGSKAVEIVKAAVVAGHVVGLVVECDDAIMRPPADHRVGAYRGPSHGKHIAAVWGYEEDGEWFRWVSSWSLAYGDKGGVWLHRSRVENAVAIVVATGIRGIE